MISWRDKAREKWIWEQKSEWALNIGGLHTLWMIQILLKDIMKGKKRKAPENLGKSRN
jgi:hypothetical protein